ncbi:MAG TPA: hypothetical protein VJ570_04565, partial [Holophagaceae bacterium]|nr:hypothetical protein [Holophagaceae bacterium]
IDVALTTVKLLAAVPLNLTAVAPVNPVPVRVTVVPTPPLEGVKLEIVGAAAASETNEIRRESSNLITINPPKIGISHKSQEIQQKDRLTTSRQSQKTRWITRESSQF